MKVNLGYFGHNVPFLPSWADSHPLSYSRSDSLNLDVSISHWGQFEVKQTETVKLWRAIDAYTAGTTYQRLNFGPDLD